MEGEIPLVVLSEVMAGLDKLNLEEKSDFVLLNITSR